MTTKLKDCYECGGDIPEGEQATVKGLSYHEDCAPLLCEKCDSAANKDDMRLVDDEMLCEKCVGTCEECSDHCKKGDMVTVRLSDNRWATREICESCAEDAFDCPDCGRKCFGESVEVDSSWSDSVCECCRDRDYRYCDDCDTHHHEDHECFNHAPEREHQMTPRVGAKTKRFNKRTVGVEIETGSGATDSSFSCPFADQFGHWGYKEDCSLSEGGMELVSPPIGGDKIGVELNGVYNLLRRKGVDMEDEEAGCHIHVDYRDVRGKIVEADMKQDEEPLDLFVQWGENMTEMVRMLVERHRAENHFCNEEFGARDGYELDKAIQKKVSDTGSAAVAVRKHTIEFRIWSVTGDAEVTMARAEFSQKAVDFLHKMMNTRTARTGLELRKRWLKAHQSFLIGHTDPIKRLFGLSDECLKILKPVLDNRVAERIQQRDRINRLIRAGYLEPEFA